MHPAVITLIAACNLVSFGLGAAWFRARKRSMHPHAEIAQSLLDLQHAEGGCGATIVVEHRGRPGSVVISVCCHDVAQAQLMETVRNEHRLVGEVEVRG